MIGLAAEDAHSVEPTEADLIATPRRPTESARVRGSARVNAVASTSPTWTHVLRIARPGMAQPRLDAATLEYLARETDAPIARLAAGVFAIASPQEAPVPVERLARRLGADVVGSDAAVAVEVVRAPAEATASQIVGEFEPGRVVADMRAALAEAREVTRRLALDAGACVAAAGRSATALEIRCDDAVRRVTEAFEEGRRELRPQGFSSVVDIARLERAAAGLLEATASRASPEPQTTAAAVAAMVRSEIGEIVGAAIAQHLQAVDSVGARARAADPRLDEVHAALRTLAVALGGRLESDARDRAAVEALARDVRALVAGLERIGTLA